MPRFERTHAYLAPILAERPEMFRIPGGLAFAPADHIWKRIWMNRSSRPPKRNDGVDDQGPDALVPLFTFSLLVAPGDYAYSMTCQLHPVRGSGLQWRTDYPDVATHLCDYVRRFVLPILDGITAPRDLLTTAEEIYQKSWEGTGNPPISFNNRAFLDKYHESLICLYTVIGDFDRALAEFEPLMNPKAAWRTLSTYPVLVNELLPLLRARDIPALARLLHAWEASSIAAIKLQKHWTPTPFDWE